METAERRRSGDADQAKRLFEYERAIVMAVGTFVMVALAWNANRIVELDKAMQATASREAVTNLATDVDRLRLTFAFQKESVDRRLLNLEHYVESQRSMRETGRP